MGVPRWPFFILNGKSVPPCPPKVTPKNEKRCQKGSWIHIKVQKGNTKAVKYNMFPWHSGLSEAVTAARRTARSGVRTKARRTARSGVRTKARLTARSAYNKVNPSIGECGSIPSTMLYALTFSSLKLQKPSSNYTLQKVRKARN